MKLLENTLDYAIFLLVGTVLFQSIIFLCHFSLTILSPILATAFYLVYSVYFNKKRIKDLILPIVIVLLVLVSINAYISIYNETSYDGNYYHGDAMAWLLDGWNPFYDGDRSIEEITYWADMYPKATWIFGAILIKISGNLSSGMVANLFVTILTSFYAYKVLRNKKVSVLTSVLISVVMFFNPISIEQTHSYYVDALMGNMLTLVLLMGIEIIDEYSFHKNLLILLVSVFLINIKFTGFAFAGIANFFIWLWFLIKDRKNAFNYMYFGIAMVLIAVFVIGFNPYALNLINFRHIFFPIAGEGSQDVVTFMIPKEIYECNPIKKLLYSVFQGWSKKANLLDFEEQAYLTYDERIGAFGNMFGKLVIISALVYVYYIVRSIIKKEFKLEYVLLFLGLTGSIVCNYKYIWWFRYAPQIWLYICIAILILSKTKAKYLNVVIVALILYQGKCIMYNSIVNDYAKSRTIEEFYDDYKGQEVVAIIKNNDLEGDIYWFDKYAISRAKQYDVDLTVLHDVEVKNKKNCYPMHYYSVCPVNKN